MGNEESRSKDTNSVGSLLDHSLEVKEEAADVGTSKEIVDAENVSNKLGEQLDCLETSFAKLRAENCNLRHQVDFLSEKVVRLEKHDVHFINALKDAITLELLETVRTLEGRIRTLELVGDEKSRMEGNTEDLKIESEEIRNESCQANVRDNEGIFNYDDDQCNLSEVIVEDDDDKEGVTTTCGKEKDEIVSPLLTYLDCGSEHADIIIVDETEEKQTKDVECLLIRLYVNWKERNPSQDISEAMDEEEDSLFSNAAAEIQGNDDQLSQLKVEDQLMKLSKDITATADLGSGSSSRISKVTELLEELAGLEFLITQLMLLKQPDIVRTVVRLENWLRPRNKQEKRSMARILKLKSACCSNFIKLFPIYDQRKEGEFPDFFQEQVVMFRNKTEELDMMRTICLTDCNELPL